MSRQVGAKRQKYSPDWGIQVDANTCFTCEKPYDTDFIECNNCMRRFHIACVCDDYIEC